MTRETLLILSLTLCLAACGGEPAPEAETETAPAAVESAAEAPTVTLTRTASPDGARVFFVSPADGDVVSSPVSIEFGIEGMSVVGAGDDTPDSGHHHLIINAELPDLSLPIPADDNYVHFGDGSTSTTVELPPGTHRLQMLLGDYRHVPHDPAVKSDVITITVE